MTDEILMQAIARFMTIPFFPAGDPWVKKNLADDLQEMAATDEQLIWLAKRVEALYAEWPGMREVRAVYCSRYKPRDGREVDSAIYADGIPSERPEVHPDHLALPPAPIAEVLGPEAKPAVDAIVRGDWSRRIPAPAWPEGVKKITQADIERAEAEARQEKSQSISAAAARELAGPAKEVTE